jgi:DNA-binding NarL/FixJ family response regulator
MNELDDQDCEVLRLIQEGKSDKRIAEELGITWGAAIFHRWRLLNYYGVKTRTESPKAVQREPDAK